MSHACFLSDLLEIDITLFCAGMHELDAYPMAYVNTLETARRPSFIALSDPLQLGAVLFVAGV